MYKSWKSCEVGDGRAGQPRVCSVEAWFPGGRRGLCLETCKEGAPHGSGLGRGSLPILKPARTSSCRWGAGDAAGVRTKSGGRYETAERATAVAGWSLQTCRMPSTPRCSLLQLGRDALGGDETRSRIVRSSQLRQPAHWQITTRGMRAHAQERMVSSQTTL